MLQPRSFLFSRAPPPSSSASVESTGPRHERREAKSRPEATSKETSTMSCTVSSIESPRATTASSPVVIPLRGQQKALRERPRPHRSHGPRKTQRAEERQDGIHSPDAVPPSVAALLALTSIPPRKASSLRRRNGAPHRLTVDAILEHTEAAEKQLVLTLGKGKSPLDFLLSPPDEDLGVSLYGSGAGSMLSIRTTSSESIFSLDGHSLSENSLSFDSVSTPGYGSRSRRPLPSRRVSPSRLASPDSHPLSETEGEAEELDFTVFQRPATLAEKKHGAEPWPRKSALKSNLTASIRALRCAARSLSNLKAPMMMPDNPLPPSMISIDSQVPFGVERVPPRLEDTPTPALRRYLNPTTNAPMEARVPKSFTQTMGSTTCTASIQLQTYKVSPSAGTSSRHASRPGAAEAAPVTAEPVVARQRDMRENSDFIRIAVMEMLMRKKGKLDHQKPGRARWALPPRKPPTRPYEISEDGVPVRWRAATMS